MKCAFSIFSAFAVPGIAGFTTPPVEGGIREAPTELATAGAGAGDDWASSTVDPVDPPLRSIPSPPPSIASPAANSLSSEAVTHTAAEVREAPSFSPKGPTPILSAVWSTEQRDGHSPGAANMAVSGPRPSKLADANAAAV
eukprot:CAMPEP_0204152172 /NCGR_PEP_ID=MMETSP0361-20130328/26783_1 /ASSEMBLY_ACC=CAM_ASM_000343 /TAXON_ID=268821 /ORGANISM="Scrippsiella Hangoei, Strain SHTV-5" /LENGTH=140 /DNA_ID=CAMNT_0051107087 /DNA_START=195 /DNA_END=614 /DNA_ORIENTATION=-